MTAAVESPRLFFALWPPPAVAHALEAAGREHLGEVGRAVPRDRIHLTLLFLGPVTVAARDCVATAAGGLRVPRFQLRVDALGGWARSGVVWAAPTTPPAALAELVAGLRQGAVACGLSPEARPFAAHVTLARTVRRPPPGRTVTAVDWAVGDFVLAASRTLPSGAEYRVVARWPLG